MSFLIVYIITSFFREQFVAVMVLEYLVTATYIILYIAHPPFYLYHKGALLKSWKEVHAARRAIWENLTCKRVRKQKRDSTVHHAISMVKASSRLFKHTVYTLGRNPFTVIDMVTIPLTIALLSLNLFTQNWLYRTFLLTWGGVPILVAEWIRVWRGFSTMRLMVSRKGRSVGQQLIIFMMSLLGLMFMFACMLDVVENIYQYNVFSPSRFHSELVKRIPNWNSMTEEERNFTGEHYFKPIYVPFYTIICVQTLGSEVDAIINNYASKLMLVIYHLLFIFIVAQQSATIYTLITKGSSFFDKANMTGHFIIECSEATAEEIQDFLVEFYNPAHGVEARAADVLLVLDNETKIDDMQSVTSNRYFAERVTVHVGDIREWHFFDFISADRAEAIFIFVNPNAKNTKLQDTVALMKAMAITSFSQVKVLSMVIDPKHVPLFKQAKVQSTICVNDMKLKMMTKSLIVPGFSTIIGNLVHAAEVKKASIGEKVGSYWVDSYLEGIRNELYVVQMFSQRFWGMLFHDISREVFEHMNCLLIGVVHRGEILLNPSNDKFRVSSSDKPIIIARDLKAAQRIAVNDHWEDEEDSGDIRPEMVKSPSPNPMEKFAQQTKKSQSELDVKRLSGQIARRFSLSSSTSSAMPGSKKRQKAEQKLDFEIRKIFTRAKPRKREEFMLDAAKGLLLEKHYIIMGDLNDALFIIFSIRKQLANKKSKYTTRDEEFDIPIILMGENDKKAQQLYEKCKYFENVFFFLGDSTDTVDLNNIHVEKAASIMYLTTPDSVEMTTHETEAFIDGRVIRTVLALQHIDRNLRFVVEIVHKHSLVLLQDYKEYILARNMKKFSNVRLKMPDYVNKRMEMAYLQSILFASGQALVTRAIFPRLFCQSYFMPDIVEVVERMCGIIPSDKSKLVHMVKPPQQLIGKTFFEVFEHMLKYHRAVLLAWYCGLGARQQPYVFIAPDRNHPKLLASTDQLYVVGRPDEEDEKELVSHLHDNDPFKFGDVLFRLKNRHGSKKDATPTPPSLSPNSDSSMTMTPNGEQFLKKKLESFSMDQDSIMTPTPATADTERKAWSVSMSKQEGDEPIVDNLPIPTPALQSKSTKQKSAKGKQKSGDTTKTGQTTTNKNTENQSPKTKTSPTAFSGENGDSTSGSSNGSIGTSLSGLVFEDHHSASQNRIGSVSLPNRIKSLTPSQRNLLSKYQKHASSSDSVDSADINLKIASDLKKKSPLAEIPSNSSTVAKAQVKIKTPSSDSDEEEDTDEELTD